MTSPLLSLEETMHTLNRHLLRRHLAPFSLAFAALTSVMLIAQIARTLPGLRANDVPGSVVAEVVLLSLPFVVALTLPMAVLVAVLHVFRGLAPDRDTTAMPGGAVSVRRLIAPLLAGATCVAVLVFLWNSQIVPRSNHRLRTLLADVQHETSPLSTISSSRGDREMTTSELRGAARTARAEANGPRAAIYEVEIQKKYAIAAACLVFALLGAAVGLRLPRRGLGFVVGVSLAVFSVYYVALVAGEVLGDRRTVSPVLAMWASNVVFAIVGLALLWRLPKVAYAG